MYDKRELMNQLERLRDQHRSIDERLRFLLKETIVDSMALQALKKQKLSLKDQIVQLEHFLYPDIIA